MANETGDAQPAGTSAPPAKLPKGMVLGKDGKPCRACNEKATFSAWASQAKTLKAPLKAGAVPAAAAAAAGAVAMAPPPTDCPPDKDELGRSTWTLLHSIAATYPTAPTSNEQSEIKAFMGLFAKLYPCWFCADDFQRYMKKETVRAASRDEFGNWLCNAHNEVNKKLGKPIFDCAKWEERWRTGWKDGRCD
ncbi:ERV/ALR sulfhydryl oxidase domain-containing protein [Podospora appendiculata]|uniref:Sulfhydryl oxidase n=1 Tax=Podospora appendiculata TaxID=314037 RepID=A0AAE1CDW6_9PEZI|nr:ERV/ALR sulfhydryl oxidase domain-containing protein [Podospora appendiculata]